MNTSSRRRILLYVPIGMAIWAVTACLTAMGNPAVLGLSIVCGASTGLVLSVVPPWNGP